MKESCHQNIQVSGIKVEIGAVCYSSGQTPLPRTPSHCLAQPFSLQGLSVSIHKMEIRSPASQGG